MLHVIQVHQRTRLGRRIPGIYSHRMNQRINNNLQDTKHIDRHYFADNPTQSAFRARLCMGKISD